MRSICRMPWKTERRRERALDSRVSRHTPISLRSTIAGGKDNGNDIREVNAAQFLTSIARAHEFFGDEEGDVHPAGVAPALGLVGL